ncbi:Phosphonoacetaldehyde hydrolase [compost metagenome]
MTYEQFKALSADKLAAERARIIKMFEASRPHYLIDTIVELPAVIEDINTRLARGETPQGS